MQLRRRDIFLKIEPLERYSPLAPVTCARQYGRDCMFNTGHEFGRVAPHEIAVSSVNGLVYREYLDTHFSVPNRRKIIEADVNEPPWERRVPGAVLFAKPGERLYIHVLNGDPDTCHSLHLHGLRYGIDSDGAWPLGVRARDGRRSDEIKPEEQWTYVFDVTPDTVGAWAFHDHSHKVAANVARGLFGGLIVRDPTAACVDHEVPVFIHQMAGTGISCDFKSPTLTPGDVFTTPAFGTELGACRYHCQIHGASMWGEVQVVAGAPANVLVRAVANQWLPQIVQISPGGTVTFRNDEAEANHDHIALADGGGATTFCLNGRAYVGNTPTIVAEAGQSLRWYVFNLDMGGVWHNFHPHAARWRLPTPPGVAADVHSLSPVESFITDTEVPRAMRLPCALEDLQCDPPPDACRVRIKGDFLFHCHIEEHMMSGLAGLVRSTEYVWVNAQVAKEMSTDLPLDDGANECPVVDLERCGPGRQPPEPHDQPHVEAHTHGAGIAPMVPGTPMAGMGGLMPMPTDVSEAATKGLWELLPCDSQVLAVHAVLMHTGKVLFFAGSGNDELYTKGLRSVVWDYENGAFHEPFTPVDLFCAGQVVLPDGRVFVAGGTKDYAFTGLQDAFLFDPTVEAWIRVQDMAAGRWYPTLVTLSDGRVYVVSGGPNQNELYSTLTGWTRQAPGVGFPLYPHMFLLRDGTLFYSGGRLGGSGGLGPGRLNIGSPGTLTPVGFPAATFDLDHRDQAASVLLPPAQDQRVMILGGGDPATGATHVVDFKVASPAYVAAASLHHPRMHVNAVILPDRTVVATGGSLHGEDIPGAVLEAEIFDPTTGTWREGARATVPRLYHSIALLLPDGRVITAGSNPHRRDDELRLELYHPPYLFKGPRPFIQTAPSEVSYGDTIELHTPQAERIQWAQLIRPMATTHSLDTEQRLVDLRILSRSFCHLRLAVPREPTLAPPGWYMLFITDREGIPSTARWVHLSGTAVRPIRPPRARPRRLPVRTLGIRIPRHPEI